MSRTRVGARGGARPFGSFVLRFALLSVALGLLAASLESQAGSCLLPLIGTEIGFLDATLRVTDLSLAREGGDPVIRLEVALDKPLTLRGRTFEPDSRGRAVSSTLLDNGILPAVLLAATALAWPLRSVSGLAWRVLLLPVALALLTGLTVPLVLLAGIWGFIYQVADPAHVSALLIWRDLLLGGGQMVLAAVLGIVLAASGSAERAGAAPPATPDPLPAVPVTTAATGHRPRS